MGKIYLQIKRIQGMVYEDYVRMIANQMAEDVEK